MSGTVPSADARSRPSYWLRLGSGVHRHDHTIEPPRGIQNEPPRASQNAKGSPKRTALLLQAVSPD
ncbi:MAG: hypothetical protein RJA70_2052 [Pseudomonadota bacterium]|jgi:hypothetical protein